MFHDQQLTILIFRAQRSKSDRSAWCAHYSSRYSSSVWTPVISSVQICTPLWTISSMLSFLSLQTGSRRCVKPSGKVIIVKIKTFYFKMCLRRIRLPRPAPLHLACCPIYNLKCRFYLPALGLALVHPQPHLKLPHQNDQEHGEPSMNSVDSSDVHRYHLPSVTKLQPHV